MTLPPCLEKGIFARTTVKPLSSVFNFEREKRAIEFLMRSGEWFVVSGLRRTGKTTLVRSIAESLDLIPIYVNMWEAPIENLSLDVYFEMLKNAVASVTERRGIRRVLNMIEKISFLGVTVEMKRKARISMTEALKTLCRRNRVVLILDEVQELLKYPEAFRYLAALHDILAPRMSVVFLGSIASLKRVLERHESFPLYGRIGEEIVLKPFDERTSIKMLEAGFDECGVSVSREIIEDAALRLGGFPGWLTHFGRTYVLMRLRGEDTTLDHVIGKMEEEAAAMIYGEVARALYGRRRISSYLRILRYAAEMGEISVSEAARIIGKVPSTAITYLKYLLERGLMKKVDDRYKIADPVIRRVALRPDFEREVKMRAL